MWRVYFNVFLLRSRTHEIITAYEKDVGSAKSCVFGRVDSGDYSRLSIGLLPVFFIAQSGNKAGRFCESHSIPSGEPTRIHASDVTGSTNVATNEGAVADLSEFKRAVDPLTGEIASVDKDQKTVTAWAFDGKVLWSKNVVEEIPLFPTIGPPPEDFTNFFSTTNDRVKMLTPAERSEMRIGSIDFFKDYVCLRVDRAFVDLDKRTGEIKNSSMR